MTQIHKSILSFICSLFFIIFFFFSCQTSERKGEYLAKVYCSSCHDYPDPSLLDKTTWEKSVLPNMALRMGFGDPIFTVLSNKSDEELKRILASNAFYQKPVIDSTELQQIVDFYIKNAPEKLPQIPDNEQINPNLKYFDIEPRFLSDGESPTTTFVGIHPRTHELFVAESAGIIRKFKDKLEIEKIKTTSPVSDIDFSENAIQVLEMGIMNPNDALKGSLRIYERGKSTPILTNLTRPVNINKADLDKDGKQDIVVCEHGDYTGQLAWYQNLGNGSYKVNLLNNMPGARRTIIKDWNRDSRPDVLALMGQGREGLFLYKNNGSGQFSEKRLLTFPPVHGSSYFEVVDINKDGFDDVVYTNGDNSDLSSIHKPYHGVRIYLNDGYGNLSEKYSQPLNGASKVLVEDFDQDGDFDMAVISFFPDLKKNQRFVFFENIGNLKFNLSTFADAPHGKWLVACTGDIDSDGDQDIVLGSYPFSTFWEEPKDIKTLPSIIILRNKTKKK